MNRLTSQGARISNRVLRLDAAGVADGLAVSASPGSVIIEIDDASCRLLFAGHPADADRHPANGDATRKSLPTKVITPALVNAHTHLDLTHIGPRPHSPADGFVSWIRMVMQLRAVDPATIRASVGDGVRRSLAGGVAGVGDIAGGGSLVPLEELQREAVGGVSYLEVFGIGAGEPRGAAEAEDWAMRSAAKHDSGARIGVSPHAPYSAGGRVFRASDRAGVYASAHVAESIEERELVRDGAGPFRAFLDALGVRDNGLLEWFGRGAHPIDLALDAMGPGDGARWLFAHVNDCGDAQLARLAERGVSVAFCARGHTYFGHPARLGPHRWREMLDAGINVCLATDSIINLPEGEGSARISPLDEARFLWQAGSREAGPLLRMITSNPARAIGLGDRFDLAGGVVGGLIAISVGEVAEGERPESAVMRSDGGVEWLSRNGRLVGAASR